jgi:hypothetical protein
MINLNRDIMVMFRHESMSEQAIQKEVENLNKILIQAESHESFCTAHELVNRNAITSDRKKIIKEAAFYTLRPFKFLLNKN